MQEAEDHDGIVVFLGNSNKIQVIMFVEIEDIVLFVLYNGPDVREMVLEGVFVEFENLLIEHIVDVARKIRAEVT